MSLHTDEELHEEFRRGFNQCAEEMEVIEDLKVIELQREKIADLEKQLQTAHEGFAELSVFYLKATKERDELKANQAPKDCPYRLQNCGVCP